ncbi:MAG TPA: hypothetical protein VHK90_10735 [Thermoanaerobaculia bacterium]|nr:hypothetical protein [Thermoanaerobaculia bacterium]
MRSNAAFIAALFLVLACGGAEEPPAPSTATTTAVGTTDSTATGDGPVRRNHFKGWKVQLPYNATVMLTERSTPAWPAELDGIVGIFNPAVKQHNTAHGTKEHPLHYVAYAIREVRSNPATFPVRNQFGNATWHFTRQKKSWLLVPARKTHNPEPGEAPPGDHLLCFAVDDDPMQTSLTIDDRFTRPPLRTVTKITPSHYCVPVAKQFGDRPVEEPSHRNSYLAIYSYELTPSETYKAPVWIVDQFHPQPLPLPIGHSERLAVPAW